jgi:Tfp pilus assembly protein PilV
MHHDRLHQRGSSLFEALVAFLVLSLGMIALARMQGQQRSDADIARQRTEAARLAQDDMESTRSTRPFAAIVDGSRSVNGGATTYRIERMITPLDAPQSIAATVSVRWTDRNGTEQRLELHMVLSDPQPALAGALLAAGAAR